MVVNEGQKKRGEVLETRERISGIGTGSKQVTNESFKRTYVRTIYHHDG